MRDPDLVVRAQQAATALESAWRRWRDMHGLGTDPLPAVSSYVGYSLEVPWGQARVVLGICAEEAELLAAMLQRHDCVGPVHAAVTARSVGYSPGNGVADAGGQPGAAGLVHVPAPAPASAGQQPLSAGSAFSRPDPLAGRSYRDPAAASALTSAAAPHSADIETPIALAASRAVEASMASRQQAVNGSAAGRPGHAAGRAGDPADAAVPDRAPSDDDHPNPDLSATENRTAEPGRSITAEPAGPADGAGLADATAATAVGGLPAMPLTQPFPWAAELMQGRSTRQPLAGRGEEPSAAPPEIVAFRPRPELFSQPGARQPDQASPANGDEGRTEHPEGDPGRVSRVLRGASLSTLMRQSTAADRPATLAAPTADRTPAPAPDHAAASDRAPAPAHDRAAGPAHDAAAAPTDDQDRAESPGWQQADTGRVSAAAANADAATWAAGELPGQAAVTDTAV
jgi:hypothetical protein